MLEFDYNDNNVLIKDSPEDEWRIAEPSEIIHEIFRLQERCDELGSDKNNWYRMAELHCHTIDRLKKSMLEAMALLQKESRPEAAFSTLLLALNPNLLSAKNKELNDE